MICHVPEPPARPRPHGQRGAMFGMDARIALLIMAVLAGVGGWNMISRIESQKVDQAEAGLLMLRDGIETYYKTISRNRLPENLEELFRTGIVTDPALRRDPWGNPWSYTYLSAEVRLEDTPVVVQFATLYSRGKNAIDESGAFGSPSDFAAWTPGNDDIGVKYTSRDVELERLGEYRARAVTIVEKLESAEAAAFLEAQSACADDSAPGWCEDYNGKNWTLFNFYPHTDADQGSGAVYYATDILGKRSYLSGSLDDMQQLMMDLGLPASYAQDPWGRVLMIHPNITGRDAPPFSASLCYSNGINCLERRE